MTAADEFKLERPALVCRWRMVSRSVPLLNRHMRALSQRRVNGVPLARGLLSWAKQHIEWSLADDTTVAVPDEGVLMLVVDQAGRAAMSVGPYEPLADVSRAALIDRARTARREADATGVAPEVLCAAAPAGLIVGADESQHLAGAVGLAVQLARTKGVAVTFDPHLVDSARPDASVFLVSDEHGIVPDSGAAAGATGLVPLLADGYATLLTRARNR